MNNRIEHIDSIRALAVLLMVTVHAAATWGPPPSTQPSFLVYLVSGMGGLAAPLFVTVFGWGCTRTQLSQSQRIKRGVFFIAAQTGVNLSAPHLFDPFSPGVLTLFGLLILLQPLWLVPATKKPNRSHLPFLTILGFSLFLTIFLSQWQGSIEWSARNETPSASQWIHHALLTGTYPVLPWVVFASLGAWIGCQEGKQITFPQNNTTFALVLLGLVSCALSFTYAWSTDQQWALPTGKALLTFFPANAMFLIAALTGVCLLWLSLQNIRLNGLAPLGQRSLSVYLTHFIPIGLLYHIDEVNAFTFIHSMGVVVIYTLVWIPIAHAWGRLAPRMDAEHALRWLTK